MIFVVASSVKICSVYVHILEAKTNIHIVCSLEGRINIDSFLFLNFNFNNSRHYLYFKIEREREREGWVFSDILKGTLV